MQEITHKITDKELQKNAVVNWENPTVLELGQKLVTIISRGRALQISDAKIMRDIMECLAKNGYGRMVRCRNFGVCCANKFECEKKYNCSFDDLPCDDDGVMFESIKMDGKNDEEIR